MKILLGVPYNGSVAWQSAQSAWNCASGEHQVQVASLPTSLLALGFNSLLAEALNRNEAGDFVQGMAMLHADLSADGHWLDTLVRVMVERDADFVSAVNAIKDDRGLTSSGVGVPGEPWMPLRRFTMRELDGWPKTFSAEDIGYGGMVLLHNTGCWLANLEKPLFHEADENGELRAHFTIRDRVVRRGGKWQPQVEPEDWYFSRRLHELGAKSYVTREVVTHHYGQSDWDNQTVRGRLETDTDVAKQWHVEAMERVRVNQ